MSAWEIQGQYNAHMAGNPCNPAKSQPPHSILAGTRHPLTLS